MEEYRFILGKPEVIVLENGRLVIKDSLAVRQDCEEVIWLANRDGMVLMSFPFYKGGHQLKLVVSRGDKLDMLVQRINEGLYEFSPFPNSSPYAIR